MWSSCPASCSGHSLDLRIRGGCGSSCSPFVRHHDGSSPRARCLANRVVPASQTPLAPLQCGAPTVCGMLSAVEGGSQSHSDFRRASLQKLMCALQAQGVGRQTVTCGSTTLWASLRRPRLDQHGDARQHYPSGQPTETSSHSEGDFRKASSQKVMCALQAQRVSLQTVTCGGTSLRAGLRRPRGRLILQRHVQRLQPPMPW